MPTLNSPKTWSECSNTEIIDAFVTAKKLVDVLEEILKSRAHKSSLEERSGASYKKVRRKMTFIDEEKVKQWAGDNDILLPFRIDLDENRLMAHFGPEFVPSLKEAGLVRQKVIEYYSAKPSTSREHKSKGKSKILLGANKDDPEDGALAGPRGIWTDFDCGGSEQQESK